MHFRIGVNLGDVMVKGDDLLGDGVNVAARLKGIAEPGKIYVVRRASTTRSPASSTSASWTSASRR